jgi:hypothetical protein
MIAFVLLALVRPGPVAGQEDVETKIVRLERELLQKKGFDFGLHNELRRLYSGIDVKKSLAHCDAIFRQDPTNEYTLEYIGARNPDKAKAMAELLRVAAEHPELAALAASCRLKAANLTMDPAERKALLQRVADARGDGLDRHRALAGAPLNLNVSRLTCPSLV